MRLNGLDFHVETGGSGPPLLLLHGFTGSVRTWDHLRSALIDQATVIAIDLIGHGQSAAPYDSSRYSLDWAVCDLTALLDALNLPACAVLGYSMGGRVALYLAVHAQNRVSRLILESATPGIDDGAERQQRRASDDALADRIVRDGVAAFVAEWERQPLLAPAPHVAADVRAAQHRQRLDNSPVGLANSLRGMGTGQQPPLWADLAQLTLPVSLVVGQLDPRYRHIAERMMNQLPDANLSVVGAAGHTVHVDQPAQFAHEVKTALTNKLTHRGARC